MNIKKQFSRFLELLGIDFKKYENEIVIDRNGESYTLKDIDAQKIKEFVWADFFAGKNELVLFDYKEDVKNIIEKINKCQNTLCFFGNILENKNDMIRTKDIGCFISRINGIYNNQVIFFIDRNDSDTFILAGMDLSVLKVDPSVYISKGERRTYPPTNGRTRVFIVGGTTNHAKLNMQLKKYSDELKSIAKILGIVIFETWEFRNWKNSKDAQVYDTLKNKNMIFEQRNQNELEEIERKTKAQIAEVASIKLKEKDDEEYTKSANKTFDKMAENGLNKLFKEHPKVKETIIEAFKIVLFKKWAKAADLTRPDYIECDLFHWYYDCAEAEWPTKEQLIFFIKERIEQHD